MKNTTHYDIVKYNMIKAVNSIIETTSNSFLLEYNLVEEIPSNGNHMESDGCFDEVLHGYDY